MPGYRRWHGPVVFLTVVTAQRRLLPASEADSPADWPWSSFQRYVHQGWYEANGCGDVDLPGSVEYSWSE